jgi:hypothetical protein
MRLRVSPLPAPSFFVLNTIVKSYYKIKQNGGVSGAPSRITGAALFFTPEWGDIPRLAPGQAGQTLAHSSIPAKAG